MIVVMLAHLAGDEVFHGDAASIAVNGSDQMVNAHIDVEPSCK